jgi:hypothetical protein
MSEKQKPEKQTQKRFPLKPGWLGSLLGRGPNKEAVEAAREEAFFARRRERIDARPAGPGLKEYDLNMDRFQYSTDMTALSSKAPAFIGAFTRILKQHQAKHPESGSNTTDASTSEYVKLMHKGALLSRPTPELNDWLNEHEPQNGFFTPEMVEAAVAKDKRVAVAKRQEDNVQIWQFSDDEGNNFNLSRTTDGSRPTVRTEPYLAAKYWSEYDADRQEIVSTPQFSLAEHGQGQYEMFKSSPLASALMEDLGLQPIRLAQEIEFRVVESAPRPYFTGADAGAANFESVIAEAHVVADLPKPVE